MRRSSIDLGTNTCLLLVIDEKKNILHDESTVVRLGHGVDRNRRLDPAAMQRTMDCLRRYSQTVRQWGLDPAQTVAVATSQARDAANFEDFRQTVAQATGFELRVLTGDEEARASFQGGLLPGLHPGQCALIDIGGGSTEFMSLRHGGKSLDVGSVRFTERFFRFDPVTDPEFWACQEAIDSQMRSLLPWRNSLPEGIQLVAVAGTATWLALWHLGLQKFEAAKIDHTIMTRGDLHRLSEELKWRSIQERLLIPGMEPGRADVILAGAMILWRALEVLNFKECVISTRGLRFGVLEL